MPNNKSIYSHNLALPNAALSMEFIHKRLIQDLPAIRANTMTSWEIALAFFREPRLRNGEVEGVRLSIEEVMRELGFPKVLRADGERAWRIVDDMDDLDLGVKKA